MFKAKQRTKKIFQLIFHEIPIRFLDNVVSAIQTVIMRVDAPLCTFYTEAMSKQNLLSRQIISLLRRITLRLLVKYYTKEADVR